MQRSMHFLSACSSKSKFCMRGFWKKKNVVSHPSHFPSIETTDFTSSNYFIFCYFSEEQVISLDFFFNFRHYLLMWLLSSPWTHHTFVMCPPFQKICIKIELFQYLVFMFLWLCQHSSQLEQMVNIVLLSYRTLVLT